MVERGPATLVCAMFAPCSRRIPVTISVVARPFRLRLMERGRSRSLRVHIGSRSPSRWILTISARPQSTFQWSCGRSVLGTDARPFGSVFQKEFDSRRVACLYRPMECGRSVRGSRAHSLAMSSPSNVNSSLGQPLLLPTLRQLQHALANNPTQNLICAGGNGPGSGGEGPVRPARLIHGKWGVFGQG